MRGLASGFFLILAMLAGSVGAAAAEAQVIEFKPPLAFALDADVDCPPEMVESVNVSLKDGAPALIKKCKPLFQMRCLIEPFRDETATVLFDVTPAGEPENIRIALTTNPCLNQYVAAAVAWSVFEPSPKGASDYSWTISIPFNADGWEKFEPAVAYDGRYRDRCAGGRTVRTAPVTQGWRYDFGLAPKQVRRCWPSYEERCFAGARPMEMVLVVFDIAEDGSVGNVRSPAASNECVVRSAVKTVSGWGFEESGKKWPGQTTMLTFELAQ